MVMRLARLWGYQDPDDLADLMTPAQVTEWIAYDQIEPFGDDWKMSATIAAATVNAMVQYMCARAGRAPTADELAKPDDFIPRPAWLVAEQQRQRGLTDDESEQQMRGLI